MQSDSSSLDTLKNSLLSAVDADHNVTNPELVMDIITQLEQISITRDQLQTTRLGREINTIRQKIDARKKNAKEPSDCPQSLTDIAQRAKKLLRSWQGLLNTSQTDSNNSSTTIPQQQTASQPPPPVTPQPVVSPINGETHESTSPLSEKPRLILKVKINPSITSNSNNDTNTNTNTNTKIKRKRDTDVNGLSSKRRKAHVETPITPPPPISPVSLVEPTNSLPRVKTTQELLLQMQKDQPDVLSTQTPMVNAILHNQIIDASLHETGKVDYSALHHGRDTTNANTNYHKQLSSSILPNVISPTNSTLSSGSSSKRPGIVRRPSSTLVSANTNWENGSSAGGSPISPSSSSSSSITSTTSWPISTNIPEPPSSIPVIPKKKRRRKHPDDHQQQIKQESEEQLQQQSSSLSPLPSQTETYPNEQSPSFSSDLATICSSYNTVADLTEAHRRRILAEHDARELEARPDLLLVPIDQLAFVYERERTKQLHNLTSDSKQTSLTTVDKLEQPSGLIALPFIDCPLEFDLVLDELVVQQPTMDM